MTNRGCRGSDRMAVAFTPITTKAKGSNPPNSEVLSIQHYVIKFVSDRSVAFSRYVGFAYQ